MLKKSFENRAKKSYIEFIGEGISICRLNVYIHVYRYNRYNSEIFHSIYSRE